MEPITDSEIVESIADRLLEKHPIHSKVSYFKATPDECRRLLWTFRLVVGGRLAVDAEAKAALYRFIGVGLERYFSGNAVSLDHAFGLVRRRGNPSEDAKFIRRYSIAMDVYAEKGRRGLSLDDAVAAAAERLNIRESYARDAYIDFLPILGDQPPQTLK